jgi:heterogeneous nuclear ribonucleoprotein A1/A3
MLPKKTAIFVGGLNSDTTSKSLTKYFSQFGDISEVVLRLDKITFRNRGFGFIYYTSEESIATVLSQEHIVDGHNVDCEISCKDSQGKNLQDRDRNMIETKLFITNLPPSLNDCEFRKIFEAYGGMKQCYIVTDPKTHQSKGFGFVR